MRAYKNNYNTASLFCQGETQKNGNLPKETTTADKLDKLERELVRKFTPKRAQTLIVSETYEQISLPKRAARLFGCGTLLGFVEGVDGYKLQHANFCRDRFCPMCAWRRSYKIFAQVSQIMNVIQGKYAFVFLTLTVPNCSAADLKKTIDKIQVAWHKLIHYKRFENAVCGYFKAVEVTRNRKRKDYHPHLHVVLAVDLDYFSGAAYIPQAEFLEMWRRATKDPTITQVNVQKAKGRVRDGQTAVEALSSAVAEIAKYSVKPSEYIGKLDKDGNVKEVYPDNAQTLSELVPALAGRRFCSFGGIFEDVRKQLGLDDPEDGDLVHIDGTITNEQLAEVVLWFKWSCGFYKLLPQNGGDV